MTEADGRRVLWFVAGRAQAEDAALVTSHLDVPVTVVTLGASADSAAAHVPGGGVRALFDVHRTVRRHAAAGAGLVVVSGQDIGRLQRAAFAAARSCGARRVLVPDGVVFEPGPDQRRSVARVADRVLSALGVVVGSHDTLGASRPDVVASWGTGWNDVWSARAPGSAVVTTGSPRSDALAALPPVGAEERLLVASQPLWLPGFDCDDAEVARWYRWLSAAVADGPGRTRVRLHPIELADGRYRSHGLTDSVLDVAALTDSLAWASTVVTPASTVALEAAAAGRRAVLIDAGGGVRTLWRRSVLFRDPSWPVLDVDLPAWAQQPASGASFDGDAYLAHVGDAARRVATVIASA